MRLETLLITVRSFEKDYHIDGDEFGRAYKDHISGFRTWTELDHADEWLIFLQNIGPHVSIDETCLSTGEIYTIVSNKDAHRRKGCIIAIVKGTKANDVIKVLKKIEESLRIKVIEVTLDFSESMHNIVMTSLLQCTTERTKFSTTLSSVLPMHLLNLSMRRSNNSEHCYVASLTRNSSSSG